MSRDRESRRPAPTVQPHVQRTPAPPQETRAFRASVPVARSGHDFTRVPTHASAVFSNARSEHATPLDTPVRERVEDAAGGDLKNVRVHSGAASSAAARVLGARAFTVGSEIYLGAGARALPSNERSKLLTHEAMHAAQQGARSTAITPGMPVSSPHDASEKVASHFSQSLALRDRLRVAPHVQRDLTAATDNPVKDGAWDLNLKAIEVPGGESGMKGTIKFTPDAAAPDSNSIKLVQTVRFEDLTTGADFVWTGAHANRTNTQTVTDAATGVVGGVGIDHDPTITNPRAKKRDARVLPYYRKYWPNPTESHDGSKRGATIRPASLWDFPSWTGAMRWTLETVAKGHDTGYYYAALHWGFTLADPATGKITAQHARAARGPDATFRAALLKFNTFYKNQGTPGAP